MCSTLGSLLQSLQDDHHIMMVMAVHEKYWDYLPLTCFGLSLPYRFESPVAPPSFPQLLTIVRKWRRRCPRAARACTTPVSASCTLKTRATCMCPLSIIRRRHKEWDEQQRLTNSIHKVGSRSYQAISKLFVIISGQILWWSSQGVLVHRMCPSLLR